jgi:hypothetical protein
MQHRSSTTKLVALAALVLALGCGLPAASASTESASPAALTAANSLIALSWPALVQSWTTHQIAGSLQRLNGRKIFSYSGGISNIGLKWNLSTRVDNLKPHLNLSSPPGFSAAADNGFTIRMPLNGSWSAGISGDLTTQAKVTQKTPLGTKTLLDRTGAIPLQVTLSKIGVSASVAANRSDPNRPTLTNASLDAHATFGGTTFTPSHTVDFTLTRSANGTLTGNISVTALGFNVPGLGVGLHLDGTLIVKLFPYSTDFDITVPGTQMTANGSLVYAVVYFGGKITAKFPQPLGTVTIPTSPSLIGGLPIPVPPKIGELLALQSGSIPLRWPPAGSPADPAGKAQLPPAGTDFAGSAKMLEGGIAQHVPPNNAVLSLDYTGAAVTPKPGKPGKPAFTYGVDADSTIWTGHYLAAEAFRYAATKSDESLARVQQLIQGLQRDFDVTSDAVIQDHRYTAVPASERGVFARSAIPDSGTLWTDPPAARINRGECLYVKPTGGWRAGAKTYPTYAAAKASPVARAIQRSPHQSRPVQRHLHGSRVCVGARPVRAAAGQAVDRRGARVSHRPRSPVGCPLASRRLDHHDVCRRVRLATRVASSRSDDRPGSVRRDVFAVRAGLRARVDTDLVQHVRSGAELLQVQPRPRVHRTRALPRNQSHASQ